MGNTSIYVSELSTSKHTFNAYHFCRGNSKRRKSRLGVIISGYGDYIYLGRRLSVKEGDVVFIPENIYCYSEWHGAPKIEVKYLSCFIHYDNFSYAPQVIQCTENEREEILKICQILSAENGDELEAYALFYRLLQTILPKMKHSQLNLDKSVQSAIEYITDNWSTEFSMSDLARKCCISESTLYHSFQKTLGQTPISFLNSIKINIAIEHLENSNYSISMISRLSGFNSENHFRKVFKSLVGTTPMKYRNSR